MDITELSYKGVRTVSIGTKDIEKVNGKFGCSRISPLNELYKSTDRYKQCRTSMFT